MNKTIIFTAVIMIFTLFFSTEKAVAETPKEVVAAFCKLDFEGNRLSSEKYKNIKSLVSYPDEPGWDTVIGIHGYEIKKEKIENASAEITVEYEIDRQWPNNPSNKEKYKTETFHLKQENSKWKITKYIMFPRVSSKILCTEHGYCETGS
jgi:hypothetical protein